MLEVKFPSDFEFLADKLYCLKIDIVQRCTTGNEVRRGFCIAHTYRKPFIPAQMIGNPSLAPLALASNPIAKELALIGVTLPLDRLPVHEVTILTCDV